MDDDSLGTDSMGDDFEPVADNTASSPNALAAAQSHEESRVRNAFMHLCAPCFHFMLTISLGMAFMHAGKLSSVF